jgi:hypothetical protein
VVSRPRYVEKERKKTNLPSNIDMKRKINMCFLKSMIFILIEIKIDIDVNNDELLIIIWERNKEEIYYR